MYQDKKTHLPQTKPCLFMNTWGPLDVATAGAAAMVKRCGVDQSCADGQSLSVTGGSISESYGRFERQTRWNVGFLGCKWFMSSINGWTMMNQLWLRIREALKAWRPCFFGPTMYRLGMVCLFQPQEWWWLGDGKHGSEWIPHYLDLLSLWLGWFSEREIHHLGIHFFVGDTGTPLCKPKFYRQVLDIWKLSEIPGICIRWFQNWFERVFLLAFRRGKANAIGPESFGGTPRPAGKRGRLLYGASWGFGVSNVSMGRGISRSLLILLLAMVSSQCHRPSRQSKVSKPPNCRSL